MDKVSMLTKPIMVCLSSSTAATGNDDGTNSNVTFNISNNISTPSEQQIGQISLASFTFTNNLPNVTPKNHTLTVTSTYYVYGNLKSSTYTINLSYGYYNITQMLALLNESIPIVENGFLYTFGSTEKDDTDTFLYPVFTISSLYGNLTMNFYASLLTQTGYSTTSQNPHQYVSFTFDVSNTTYPLQSMLGMLNKSNNPTITQNMPLTILCTPTYSGTSCTYSLKGYNGINPGSAWVDAENGDGVIYDFPYPFNMQYTDTLYVETPTLSADFRSPYNNLNASSIIGTVPITSTYQTLNFTEFLFMPKYIKNLSISSLTITIRDEYGNLVDFQGNGWKMVLWIAFAQDADLVQPDVSAQQQNMGDLFAELQIPRRSQAFNTNTHPFH